MNRRTWKDFLTNRSTIWTLSLFLVGAIVLGGMAAVTNSRDNHSTQSETELGQIAYLEEDRNEENEEGSILADEGSASDADNLAAADEEAASASSSRTEDSANTNDSLTGGTGDSADADSSLTGGTGDSTDTDSSLTGGTGDSTDADSSLTGGTNDSANENSGANATGEDATTDMRASDSGNAEAANASGTVSSDISDQTASDTLGEDDSSDSIASAADASDTEEAASSSILSEQALLEAGVSFTDSQSILWPCAGTVVIDYSMDKSVYFSTLNQYKYNPALIISSDSGNQVLASAKGIVESIAIDEETGTTLVLNIGNGYKLTYGQLMEPAVSEGDTVEAGDLLAYISEPTKYYSTEGSNLYFAMTKDGEPVDPVLYLE
ncbi:MAG: peptidoglycan DD-metalloendopeptidase family protein [Lachnospiraceae bacterium]|nr:peptidoglycan DD-metalloendopeptidase family protein [Lachnospiraceae bacterium]